MHSLRRALAPAVVAAAALAFACALHSSLACPLVMPPQPLRTLYKESARVVVARVGASEVVESSDHALHVRVALHVTENVKGEGERVARLYYWREKDESAEAPRLISFSGRAAPPLKQGERFLFFLDPHEDRGDGYQVNDAGYGIKQLSDEAPEEDEAPEDPEAEAAREAAAFERATRKRAAMLRDALARIDYFVSTGQMASN